MRTPTVLVLTVLALSFAVAGVESPSVTPLASPPLATGEFSALVAELGELDTLLADQTLGSQQSATEDGWGSYDFAAYTAGVLAERGYDVRIVASEGWVDGAHAWVLVKLPPPAATVWIPVEAAPTSGAPQLVLGRIPSILRTASAVGFEERYSAFSRVNELPSNQVPVADLRLLGSHFAVSETVTLQGFRSHDSDGKVTLYRWRVGDGVWLATRSSTTLVDLPTAGSISIVLQVVDNRGASGSSVVVVTVGDPDDAPPEDCGCGG